MVFLSVFVFLLSRPISSMRAYPVFGGEFDVRWKNDLGNTSDRWVHNVYFVILFPVIDDDPVGEDSLLQKPLQDEEKGIYGTNQKGVERR